MSEKRWTDSQKKAIELRGSDILVSAGAGSGKTAVLVERILQLVLDENNDIDIDNLLVVTFTRAAAAQMRDKIGEGMDKRLLLAEEAKDEELEAKILRQKHLLAGARICTIDSFCSYVVKNYFSNIDLSPDYRIMDKGEGELIYKDAMDEMLEEAYEEPFEGFEILVKGFSDSKSDKKIEEIVRKVFDMSETVVNPEKWLIELDKKEFEEYEKVAVGAILENAGRMLRLTERNIKKTQADDFVWDKEKEVLDADREGILAFLEKVSKEGTTLENILEAIDLIKFGKVKTILNKSFEKLDNPEEASGIYKDFKALRERTKEILKGIFEDYLFMPYSLMVHFNEKSGIYIKAIAELTRRFRKALSKEKAGKGVLEFSDLSHYALAILTNEDGEPTSAARELAGEYKAIIIDEYQDSSMLQEAILKSICDASDGKTNMFMVGDIKQSIYAFRQARPELFMEKYESFDKAFGEAEKGALVDESEKAEEDETRDDSTRVEKDHNGQLVVMNTNFRSRKEVLDSVDMVFEAVMHKSVGAVEYDEDASLKPGMEYPAPEREGDYVTELLLAVPEDGEDEDSDSGDYDSSTDVEEEGGEGDEGSSSENGESAEEVKKSEAEALVIVNRIREIIAEDGLKVTDEELDENGKKKLRKARMSDIAVLVRSRTNISNYIKVFEENGIEAVAEQVSGYFASTEIERTLNYLRIIDNPLQDIPFASVLSSVYVGISADELAEITFLARKAYREKLSADNEGAGNEKPNDKYNAKSSAKYTTPYLANAVSWYAENGAREELRTKLNSFLSELSEFRKYSAAHSVTELIEKLYDDTKVLYKVSAMPDGERRKGNLKKLEENARNFEATSFRGLFEFLRYVQRLIDNDVDYGLADSSLGPDVLKVMTIHGSKGLEFPIVFVAGIDHNFNDKDLKGSVMINADLGIGLRYVGNEDEKFKVDTLAQKMIKRRNEANSRGEELRVLYVAMTRAKEKLILTGALNGEGKKVAERFDSWESAAEEIFENGVLPQDTIIKDKNYLDIIAPEFILEEKGDLHRSKFIKVSYSKKAEDEAGNLDFENELSEVREEKAFPLELKQKFLSGDFMTLDYDKEDGEAAEKLERAAKELQRLLNFEYRYQADVDIPYKFSVSALKKTENNVEAALSDEEGRAVDFENDTEHAKLEDKEYRASHSAIEKPIPSFLQKERIIAPTEKGTAVHALMEHADFPAIISKVEAADYEEYLSRHFEAIVRGGYVDRAVYEEICKVKGGSKEFSELDINTLGAFFKTELARKMSEAARRNELYREQKFVLGLSADEIAGYLKECGKGESDIARRFEGLDARILIQGVIDGFFIDEDGSVVLMDYKTDKCKEQEMIDRYKLQLELYKRAIESAANKKVKEIYIYAVRLGKSIEVI
jgi:ATP-dependent helicase/nuclease subunit A